MSLMSFWNNNNVEPTHSPNGDLNVNAKFADIPKGMMPTIVNRMGHMQLSDGCTGGCAWCALDVQRKITTQFSGESLDTFFRANSRYLRKAFSLYWASDPLDWQSTDVNGRPMNYADLMKGLMPRLSSRPTYTSTVIPSGREEVFVTLMDYVFHETQRNARKVQKVGMHTVRVSVTDRNREFFNGIHLRFSDSFRREAVREYLDSASEEKNSIKYQGKFFKHSKRNLLSRDTIPVACYDGVLISPSGKYSISFESATAGNPFGYRLIELSRNSEGNIIIPQYVHLNDYRATGIQSMIDQYGHPLMLPPIIMDEVDKKGRVTKSTNATTIRREALSFQLLHESLLPFADDVDLHIPNRDFFLAQTIAMVEERYRGLDQAIAMNGNDSEAVKIAEHYYSEVKKVIEEIADIVIINILGFRVRINLSKAEKS